MNLDVSLRVLDKLTGLEIKRLTELLKESVDKNEGIDVDPSGIGAHYLKVDRLLGKSLAVMVVAEHDLKIVGSIYARYYEESFVRHIADFRKLIVDSNFRRLGIGRKLVVALEEAVRQRGALKIELSYRVGNPASKLYESLGYTQWGRSTCAVRYGETCYDEVHMEKMLNQP